MTDESIKPWRNPAGETVLRYVLRILRVRASAVLSAPDAWANLLLSDSEVAASGGEHAPTHCLPFGVREIDVPLLGSSATFRLGSVTSVVISDQAAVCAPHPTPDSVLLMQPGDRVSVVKLQSSISAVEGSSTGA